MTLVQHLLELRNAMTKAVLAILVIFLVLFPFANDLYVYISEPLSRYLPAGTSMIATGVASPFLTPFKLSLIMAIYVAMPYLLYQLWTFIAPALYTHEKQLVGPILFFSSFLFYAGGAFAFYIVFPLVFGFLSTTAPEGVTIATDIALYLDFVIKMFFAFGIAFEVPVIVVLLILTGMVSAEKLSHARPYIVVAAFVIGMLLTPPDIVSQTLLAVPMWLLYEAGVIVGAYVKKKRDAAKLRREAKEGKSEEKEAQATPSAEKTTAAATAAGEAEMEFDDRYADQVDDDDDWDEAFDEIDSAFGALDLEYEARKKEKEAGEGQKTDNESDSSTEDAETSNDSSDAQTNESEKRPTDKPE
ncbi:MAG: twin-arginine translocase subunit TatC [Hydrogenovibrio sp.]|nr:twin-arginine translocase subunit TatC [Hydrogenovibrio sp.]